MENWGTFKPKTHARLQHAIGLRLVVTTAATTSHTREFETQAPKCTSDASFALLRPLFALHGCLPV